MRTTADLPADLRRKLAQEAAARNLEGYSRLVVEALRHLREREDPVGLCEIVDLTRTIAGTAAGLYTELEAKGEPIPNEDLLIAATSLERGYALLTGNRAHFRRVPGLVLA
jgi:predicted nucleic acid-binding protein